MGSSAAGCGSISSPAARTANVSLSTSMVGSASFSGMLALDRPGHRPVQPKSRELTTVNSTAAVVLAAAGVLVVLGPRQGTEVRGILVRDRFGVRRMAAGIRVPGLEAGEFDVEARVQRRGQRGQRPQGQVLPTTQNLAHPPGRDAHAGREVGPGETALPHMPVDLVRQLRDKGEHLFVNLSIRGPLAWRNA